MNGYQRRAYAELARKRRTIAERKVGLGDGHDEVAEYVRAAVFLFHGRDRTAAQERLLASPPLAYALTVDPPYRLLFTPCPGVSRVRVAPSLWPALAGPGRQRSFARQTNNRTLETHWGLGRDVQSDSDLQRWDLALTSIEPDVVAHCEEVWTGPITVVGGPVLHGRYIDRVVEWRDGSRLARESKWFADLDPEEEAFVDRVHQLTAHLLFAHAHRIRYEVRTERDVLRNWVLLQNALTLLPYGREKWVDKAIAARVLWYVGAQGPTSIRALSAAIGGRRHRVWDAALYLVFSRRLVVDTLATAPLTDRAEVHLG